MDTCCYLWKPTLLKNGAYHIHIVQNWKHGSCHGNQQVSQSIAHRALVAGCAPLCQSPPLKRDCSAPEPHCLAGHLVFMPLFNSEPTVAVSAQTSTVMLCCKLGMLALLYHRGWCEEHRQCRTLQNIQALLLWFVHMAICQIFFCIYCFVHHERGLCII